MFLSLYLREEGQTVFPHIRQRQSLNVVGQARIGLVRYRFPAALDRFFGQRLDSLQAGAGEIQTGFKVLLPFPLHLQLVTVQTLMVGLKQDSTAAGKPVFRDDEDHF